MFILEKVASAQTYFATVCRSHQNKNGCVAFSVPVLSLANSVDTDPNSVAYKRFLNDIEISSNPFTEDTMVAPADDGTLDGRDLALSPNYFFAKSFIAWRMKSLPEPKLEYGTGYNGEPAPVCGGSSLPIETTQPPVCGRK
jgi:hypothetical protein